MAIERSETGYRLRGPVTMDNARSVLEEGIKLFADAVSEVDLSEVTEADSSAVSVMLEWRREAQRRNRQVHYVNLPENVRSLANLYGVLETVEDRRRTPRADG